MAANIPISNCVAVRAVQFGADKTWSSVAAGTSAEQTITIPGLRYGLDHVLGLSKPSRQNNLAVASYRISADDTLAIHFLSASGTITPTASEVWTAWIVRMERAETDFNV